MLAMGELAKNVLHITLSDPRRSAAPFRPAEDCMRTDPALMISLARNAFRFAVTLTFALICLPSSHAQTVNLSGRYQCAEAKVGGKIIPCNAAPLILKNDGKFELRGWEGSYSISGEFVELSDSVVALAPKSSPATKSGSATAASTAGAKWSTNAASPNSAKPSSANTIRYFP